MGDGSLSAPRKHCTVLQENTALTSSFELTGVFGLLTTPALSASEGLSRGGRPINLASADYPIDINIRIANWTVQTKNFPAPQTNSLTSNRSQVVLIRKMSCYEGRLWKRLRGLYSVKMFSNGGKHSKFRHQKWDDSSSLTSQKAEVQVFGHDRPKNESISTHLGST